MAYVDDEGYVYICDRKKDMIISGGVNIYPGRDRGRALRAPAGARRRGVRHPRRRMGRARCTRSCRRKPGETIDLDELRAFAEPRLANYKRPREYELRDELPRTDSGKLLKRVLRDEYWQGTELRRMSEGPGRSDLT